MKTFYSLAMLSAVTAASNERVVCKANAACADAMEAVVSSNDNNNRRRRDTAQNAVVVSKDKIFEHFNHSGDRCSIVPQPADCKKEIAPRFGLKIQIPVINNYGCWCYGGESWPGARDDTGFGPAMDEYDEACKAHHQGFDCITLDANAEGETCQPNETSYDVTITPQASGDYHLECSNSIETDWCKRRTCMVDLRFLARHWKLEDDNINPDYASFGHNGFHDNQGDFDTDVCILPKPIPTGKGKNIVKVCCGEYPYRVWYDRSNFKGLRCCEYEESSVNDAYGFNIKIGKLYNNLDGTCCDYGVIHDGNVC